MITSTIFGDFDSDTKTMTFSNCTTNVKIENEKVYFYTKDWSHEFKEINTVKKMIFSKGIRCIDTFSFSDCKSLETVKFSETDGDVRIYYGAFKNCTNLKNIEFNGASIKSIGSEVFGKCESLREIKLPEKLEEIGFAVFKFCSNLEKIYIPKIVKEKIPKIKELVTEFNDAKVIFLNDVENEILTKFSNNKVTYNNLKNSYCGVMKKNLLVKRKN